MFAASGRPSEPATRMAEIRRAAREVAGAAEVIAAECTAGPPRCWHCRAAERSDGLADSADRQFSGAAVTLGARWPAQPLRVGP